MDSSLEQNMNFIISVLSCITFLLLPPYNHYKIKKKKKKPQECYKVNIHEREKYVSSAQLITSSN